MSDGDMRESRDEEKDRELISQEVFADVAWALQRAGTACNARDVMLRIVAERIPDYLSDLRQMTEKYSHVRPVVESTTPVRGSVMDDWVLRDERERRQMITEVLDFLRQYRKKSAPTW